MVFIFLAYFTLYNGLQSQLKLMNCKYFLPFGVLSFCSLDSVL